MNAILKRRSIDFTLRGNTSSALLAGQEGAQRALCIEQELESHLGTEDRPVRGGLPR